jgi:ADP-ribose pyrophosphatase YjhB (NUDIX family)
VEIVEVPEHRGLFSVFKPQKPRIHSVEEYEALLNRGDDEPEWQSKTWMEPELAAFLNSLHANFADTIVWGNGAIRLDLKGYLDIQSPPDRFVLAGRAMVVRGNEVLLVETPYGNHILPGGRRENGETTEDAVQREVLEETGWVVNNLTPFAVLHLQYQTPMPQNVGRVIYPDFIWHVFIAEPSEYREQRRIQDEREVVLAANFKPIGEVLKSGLAPFQQELLAALVR